MTFFLARHVALVTQAAAYASGDLIGGKISWEQRAPDQGGRLLRLTCKSLTSVGVASTMYLFDANPSNTTFTENGALALNSADRTKLIGAVAIASGDWLNYSAAAGLYVADKAIDIPYWLRNGERTIYGALVIGGVHTPGSIADIEAILGGEID